MQTSPRLFEGDDHDNEENEESLRRSDKEKEEEDVDMIMLDNLGPAIEKQLLAVIDEMPMMFLRLFFSQMVAQKLVED